MNNSSVDCGLFVVVVVVTDVVKNVYSSTLCYVLVCVSVYNDSNDFGG